MTPDPVIEVLELIIQEREVREIVDVEDGQGSIGRYRGLVGVEKKVEGEGGLGRKVS